MLLLSYITGYSLISDRAEKRKPISLSRVACLLSNCLSFRKESSGRLLRVIIESPALHDLERRSVDKELILMAWVMELNGVCDELLEETVTLEHDNMRGTSKTLNEHALYVLHYIHILMYHQTQKPPSQP